MGANLSSIAIPPFWPVLPITKEKRIDQARGELAPAGALT
jgi:hypothetical protein